MMHGAGDLSDTLKVMEDLLVAVDVRLEDLPVVNARLARHSGIGQNKALVQVLRGHAHNSMMNAVRIKMYGAYASVERRIVVLTSGGDLDQLRFHVLRDHAELLSIQLFSGIACQCRRGGHHQRGRAGYTRSGRRLRAGFNFKSAFRRKELGQAGTQRVLWLAHRTQLIKAGKFFFNVRVKGLEADFLVSQPGNAAAGKDVDGKIDRHRTGMKKVQGPQIQGPAGQIDTARGMSNDRSGWRQVLFRKKHGHLTKLLVAAVKELLDWLVLQLVKVFEQDMVHHGGRGIVVEMRSAVRLGNDLIDDRHFFQVRRGNAQSLRGNLFLGRVTPHDGSTALRRNDRVNRVFHHEYAVGHSQRQRTSAAAFSGDGGNDGDLNARHLAQVVGDCFRLAALFRAQAGKSTRRIDEGKDRPPEFFRHL